MKRRTKIVCTLGPAVDSREQIQELISAGMNVARLNCSHGDWDTKRRWVQWIRELESPVAPVGILADLQGPKHRIGDIPGGSIEIKSGEVLSMGPSDSVQVPIHSKDILSAFAVGDKLLLGDGRHRWHLEEPQRRDAGWQVIPLRRHH